MPYKRKYTAKRSTKRARKLNPRQKRQVKRLIGNRVETKYLDTAISGATVNTVGNITNITPIAQGTTDHNRVGDSVRVKRIRIKWSSIYADSTQILRCMIVQWKVNTGVSNFTSVGDVLEQATVQSMYNFTNQSDLFHVCYDKTFPMSLNGTGCVTGQHSVYGKRLGKHKLEFNPGASTGFGQYFVVWLSDSAGVPHPSVSWVARVEYTDS